MVTNTAADAWERVVFFKELKGFFKFSFAHEGDIALNTDMRRASCSAGGGSPLADGKGARNCLIILFVNGFSRGEAFVIIIRKINGAYLDTIAATGAF